jgi:hypothetical protein
VVQRTTRPASNKMIALSWLFFFFALIFQILNIVNALRPLIGRKRVSQILLVPVVLWYAGVLLRGSALLIGSAGLEVLAIFGIHVTVVLLAVLIDKLTN